MRGELGVRSQEAGFRSRKKEQRQHQLQEQLQELTPNRSDGHSQKRLGLSAGPFQSLQASSNPVGGIRRFRGQGAMPVADPQTLGPPPRAVLHTPARGGVERLSSYAPIRFIS